MIFDNKMSNSNNLLETESEQLPSNKAKLHYDTSLTLISSMSPSHQQVNYIFKFIIEVCIYLRIKPMYIWSVLSAGKCNT